MNDSSTLFPRLTTLLMRKGMSEEFQARYFRSFEQASNQQIATLHNRVPWLPDDYIQFLRITNGCVLEFFVFFGIGVDHPYPSDDEQWQILRYGSDRWFAVGRDRSGSLFVINRNGKIGVVRTDPLD